ncbi:von Willebrand factor D and EGF domain-containing protein-like [Mya arenaria]|uniref:von Willebrand factor D and EGF domain-containing protein-like n=1 Tax=Mya arenaria TaxID=6604 RepID=UPI0022DF9E2C|nr:von Willebrand factor D and EGF domain-containing protein-like [Mya arenaria]
MTFDSIRRKYTNLHVGQYVMLKRKKSNFRVDARTFSNGRASFNCGVAMRDGTDVIILDMCWGRMGTTYPKLEIRNRATFSNKTEIVQSGTGNQFVFKFPSGAIVTAKQMKNFLNLAIFVPDTFRGDTDGLCGRFDGNQDNDLKMPNGNVVRFFQNPSQKPYQFIESWKVRRRYRV